MEALVLEPGHICRDGHAVPVTASLAEPLRSAFGTLPEPLQPAPGRKACRHRRAPPPFFSVIRHEERGDVLGTLVQGRPWMETEDFEQWPKDPPLSDVGAEHARCIGLQL